MPRKSKKPVRKQTHSPTGKVVGQVGQILLPMIAGIAATKADLTEWVYEQGLTALHLLLREDAEEIAGLKGKHEKERTHNHCGSTNGELSFGGRRIQVSRPRVRSKSGEEASLPHFEAFREEDPLPERVLNQILVGVSTRNYESSLDKPAAKLKSRGTSKSAASRHLVSQTTKKLEEYLSRRLEEFELAALMLDGLEVAGQTVVVTLGITIDGTKVPLGIWLGSTENSRVCTAMLQDLLERGLRVDESILCVVDGGKGIRKALVDVLGDLAVIQRCQIHKLRNLRSYLPKSRHAYVLQTMKEAYKCKSADKARKRLQALVSWLERNGYDEAAGCDHRSEKAGITKGETLLSWSVWGKPKTPKWPIRRRFEAAKINPDIAPEYYTGLRPLLGFAEGSLRRSHRSIRIGANGARRRPGIAKRDRFAL